MSAQTHNVDTDLWKRAVSEYTSKLSPAQRQAIMAPATVDECLQILITNSSRKRTFTRILESFRSIIDTLKRFEGSIDVLTQISTGIASPIWGPLRAAMTVTLMFYQACCHTYQTCLITANFMHQMASEHFSSIERLMFVVDKLLAAFSDIRTLRKCFSHTKACVKRLLLCGWS
jgi:hypothetical protein